MKRLSALLIVLVMLAQGCNMLLPREMERKEPPLIKPSEVKFDLYKVGRGSISQKADGIARVDSSEIESLTFKDYGMYTELLVKQDDVVKKGDVVARQICNNTGDKEYKKLMDQYLRLYEEHRALVGSDVSRKRINEAKEKMDKLGEKLLKMCDKNTELVSPIDGTVSFVLYSSLEPENRGQDMEIMTVVNQQKTVIYYEGEDTSLTAGTHLRLVNSAGDELEAYMKRSDEREKVIELNVDEKKTVFYGEWLDVYKLDEDKENILIIPINLIRNYQGRDFVEVLLPDGKKEERTIEKGVDDGTMVEIIKGLDEGDNIIIR